LDATEPGERVPMPHHRSDTVQGTFVGGPLDKEGFSLPAGGPVAAALLVVVIGEKFHHYELNHQDPTVALPVFAYRGQRTTTPDG
jgi:hypothetical protein